MSAGLGTIDKRSCHSSFALPLNMTTAAPLGADGARLGYRPPAGRRACMDV